MPETDADFYEFGPFRLDIRARRISRNGEPLPLTPKDFETLLLLVINRNRVVTKDELMKTLWPESFVEEANLTQHVFTLRKALGDQPDGKPYIDNIPRRGYRFTAPVRESVEKPAGVPSPSTRRGRRKAAYAALAAGALAAVLYLGWRRVPAPAEAPGPQSYRSIAVLPFKPLSPDSSAQDLLGLGLADALISRLSNMSEITVRPTGAVERYTKPGEDPAAVGRALRVDAVLDGTIQQVGDQIRVSVKLISSKTGAPVWNETYDARWTDLFMVQDAIVGRVATTLLLKPAPPGRGRETLDGEASRAYLLGRYYWNKRTEEGLRQAVESFQRAIRLDGEYARAYAGLADSYLLMIAFSMEPPSILKPKARAAALQALNLDDQLGEAHVSLAFLEWIDCSWDKAGQAFRRAIDLTPGYATAHHWYSLYLKDLGRHDEAVAEAKRAHELDPLSLVISADVGLVLYFARRYDEALEQFRKTLEMDRGFVLIHTYQGYAYDGKAMYDDAVAAYRKVPELSANERAHLARAYALAGRTADARRVLAELQQFSQRSYVPPETIGFALLALGERDRGFELYDTGYAGREACLIMMDSDPRYDLVRADARFSALMSRAKSAMARGGTR
jgi:DNA-binding winged helix-turn-helix (wHTH) protein/TolB-like protein